MHLSLPAAQGTRVWKNKDLGSFRATQHQHLQDPNRSFLHLSQPLITQTSLIKAARKLVHLHETGLLYAHLTSFAFSLKPSLPALNKHLRVQPEDKETNFH